MIDIWNTDYGPVRVSRSEAALLSYAYQIERDGTGAEWQKMIVAKAEAIKAACERFAKWSAGL